MLVKWISTTSKVFKWRVSSSGGPVFNIKWEVVGMDTMSFYKYVCTIHYAMLREIIEIYTSGKFIVS